MKVSPLPSLLAALALALVAPIGCGDDSPPGDDGAADGLVGDGGDVAEPDPWAAPDETDAWRVVFNYRSRNPRTSDVNDLWIMDADGSNASSITEFAKLDEEGLSCNFGCFPSPDLKWIAVADGPPSAEGGFSLKLGRFNAALEVSIFKGLTLTGVVDFKFADDRMFYSTIGSCTGPSCQYDFHVVNLEVNVNDRVKFLTFPSAEGLSGSTYKGNFKVSPDGNNLVMLQTTIRSVAVYLWRDGKGLVQLDFICKFGTQGDCSGTGSEYSDLDPVAISPDNRYIVFFTFSDRWQRARVYDTEDPDDIRLSIMASVPTGVYIERVCEDGMLEDWQWQRVIGDPVFTPDGEEVVFLSENACPEGGAQPVKSQRNVYRVKLATLLSGKTLTEDDVFNVTANPKGDVTANRRPSGFALSQDGATVVMTATPSLDQSGAPIGDGQARQRNDREVYRVRLDGENLEQISNDITNSAESPMVVIP